MLCIETGGVHVTDKPWLYELCIETGGVHVTDKPWLYVL